jgi:hypothetical protein
MKKIKVALYYTDQYYQYQERVVLRRVKLRLPSLESLPFSELKEPILPMVEAAPDVPDI